MNEQDNNTMNENTQEQATQNDATEKTTDAELMQKLRRFERLFMSYHAMRMRRYMGPQGNPHRGQGRVLQLLKMQPNIAQRDMAYLLDMRQQSLSELLGKLEQKGYIAREQDEEDKRKVNIRLTDSGQAAADAMTAQAAAQKPEPLLDCLTDEEKRNLIDYLDRMSDSLKGLLREMRESMNCDEQARKERGDGDCPRHGHHPDGPHPNGHCQGEHHPHGHYGRHGGHGRRRGRREMGMEMLALATDFDEDGLAFYDE